MEDDTALKDQNSDGLNRKEGHGGRVGGGFGHNDPLAEELDQKRQEETGHYNGRRGGLVLELAQTFVAEAVRVAVSEGRGDGRGGRVGRRGHDLVLGGCGKIELQVSCWARKGGRWRERREGYRWGIQSLPQMPCRFLQCVLNDIPLLSVAKQPSEPRGRRLHYATE